MLAQGFAAAGTIVLLGQPVSVAQLAGIVVLLLVALISAAITPRAIRQANDFTWHPMAEVAMLFAAIFITIGPVVAMLRGRARTGRWRLCCG